MTVRSLRFQKIAVIAPGLLGGSFALACRGRSLAKCVVGCARRSDTLDEGIRLGVFDEVTLHPREAVSGADLVVIGAPVRATIQLLGEISSFVDARTLVTDMGSTKTAIMAAASQLFPTGSFIGGHPMAGSHRSGISAARPDLFAGARYFLTRLPETRPPACEKLEQLVRSLGAEPLWIDAGDHDLLAAAISHLPHLAACALVEAAGETSVGNLSAVELAGTGFRDTTRVAAGQPEMWTDIAMTNRSALLASLGRYEKSLSRLRAMIENGDDAQLHRWLTHIARSRRSLDNRSSGE